MLMLRSEFLWKDSTLQQST